MPVNWHNLSALAQESGSDKIPGLWQYLSLQGSSTVGLLYRDVYISDYSVAKHCLLTYFTSFTSAGECTDHRRQE